MKKRILVTGGAGFIGSHLCERLAQDDKNIVYSLDNYFTGTKKNHVKGVKYIKGETKDINQLISFHPDIIYHLGEYSRVEQSFQDINLLYRLNKIGTFAVLEFARHAGSKIIYAGSSTKFGDGGLGRDASPYGWTKATNTELVINYGRWFNLPYAITYFYNVYGPREIAGGKYATLIASFKEKMRLNQPLTVVSPGTQTRNFTYIKDIINGLVLIGENGYGDEFGIGNKKAYSILEVASMFLEMDTDEAIKKGKLIMLPERPGNRMTSDIVTEKTESLGWSSQYSLPDYISMLRKNGWQQ